MSRILRALVRLFALDWCLECNSGYFGGPGGNWWHAEGCRWTKSPPPPMDRG